MGDLMKMVAPLENRMLQWFDETTDHIKPFSKLSKVNVYKYVNGPYNKDESYELVAENVRFDLIGETYGSMERCDSTEKINAFLARTQGNHYYPHQLPAFMIESADLYDLVMEDINLGRI